MEIRHSAILAWLLDPTENHGLDDEFLRAFLAQALLGSKIAAMSALEVSQADLRDAEIQREKRNMDISVTIPSKGWEFVIENKFHSRQGDGQLARYMDRARKDARHARYTFVHQGIFLTLNEEDLHADAADHYVPLRYTDICEILASILNAHTARIGAEVRQFLEHYLEVIREAADMSEDQKAMADLARQLYQSHKKALDFIMEHGVSNEFMVAAETVFGENLEYGAKLSFEDDGIEVMYNSQNPRTFSFLPTIWLDALGGKHSKPWAGCEKWWAGFPLICWFQLNTKSGNLFLYAEVGPLTDTEARTDLIERIKNCANSSSMKHIKFRVDATKESAKYSKFFNINNITINDVSDAEEIAKGMKTLMKDFTPVFEAISSALHDFARQERGHSG